MHDPKTVAFAIPRPWPQPGLTKRRRFYWPPLITVWHNEPNGHDSGEVCKHYRRWQDQDGQWRWKSLHGWRWHVWHWSLQIHPYQHLRRWALTRCEWCGGRSRKGDVVNHSLSWDRARGPWWRGERGLFHGDCTSVYTAHRTCMCVDPLLSHGDYGQCQFCGKGRAWRKEPDDADRALAALPKGSRITAAVRPLVEQVWAERRAAREQERAE